MKDNITYFTVGLIMLLCVIAIVFVYQRGSNTNDNNSKENETPIIFIQRDEALSIVRIDSGDDFEYNIQDVLEDNKYIIEAIDPINNRLHKRYAVDAETGLFTVLEEMHYFDMEE